MRVGIDARALLAQRTGIGIYTENIARSLASRAGMEVDLFTPRPVDPKPDFPGSVRYFPDDHRFGTVWIQTHLPRRLERAGSEVLLSALTISPARVSIPSVSVVHDLTPLSHPEWHRRKVVVAFLPWIEKTLDRAARVIALSEATARDLRGRFPDGGEKTTVVPYRVRGHFHPSDDPCDE